MGAFLTYLLKAGIFLLFFYLFNRLLLAKETFHRFNKIGRASCRERVFRTV